MNPASSSNTRSCHTRCASFVATPSSSECVTPTNTHNPRPIAPTTSPSTVTEARFTRWMSALTGPRPDGLLPLDGAGGFGGAVVGHPVHAGDLVDQAGADRRQG